MIIGNLDIKYIACFESETNSPLIIDANAPLFIPVTRQFFQACFQVGYAVPQLMKHDVTAPFFDEQPGEFLVAVA